MVSRHRLFPVTPLNLYLGDWQTEVLGTHQEGGSQQRGLQAEVMMLGQTDTHLFPYSPLG